MRSLNAIINDIRNGENVELYFTVLICFIVVIVDLLGVVQLEIITAAILLTLGVLLFDALTTRKTLGELNDTIQRIEGEQGAEAFFRDRNDYAPLPETIASAQHIYFLGPTLISIFTQYAGYLLYEKLSKQGATIQVLLLDPESPSADLAAKCMNEPLENVRQDIARSLSYMEKWLKDGIQAGSVEARLMPVHPNYSMVLIDPDEPNGRIFVEFIGYQGDLLRLHERPHIELTRQRDGRWYEHFLQQYYQLWKSSKVHLTNQQRYNTA